MKVLCGFLLLAALVVPASAQTGYVNGQAARGELGQPTFMGGFGNNYAVSSTGTGINIFSTVQGVAATPNLLFVADSSILVSQGPGNNNRVLIFDSGAFPGPLADLIGYQPKRCSLCFFNAINVLGQPDYNTATQALTVAANNLNIPTAVATDGTIVAIADTNNNRVLIYKEIPTSIQQNADLVLGQTNFTTVAVDNPVTASSVSGPQGVWIQNGKLFVADTQNSRVLIWNSIPTSNNQPADVVLGEPNFTTRYVAPNTGPVPTANSLYEPVSVTSDGTRLFVTDLGNNRVLIWNSIPTSNQQAADVELGQLNMTSSIANDNTRLCAQSGTDSSGNPTYPDICANTLSYPRFALSDGTRFYVADGGNDRILVYKAVPTTSNTAADNVLGQPDFTDDLVSDEAAIITSTAVSNNSSAGTIRTPSSLAWDGTNLWVADPFDSRVLYFTPGSSNLLLPNDAVLNAASLQIQAEGYVIIALISGDSITAGDTVTATIAGTGYTYKIVSGDSIDSIATGLVKIINSSNGGAGDPNAFARDGGNGLVALQAKAVGAAGNNVTLAASTSASATVTATASGISLSGGTGATLAPGTLVVISAPAGVNFSPDGQDHTNTSSPLTTSFENIEVYVDGTPCPIAYVNPDQIRVQIPFNLYDQSINQATNSASLYVRKVNVDGSVSASNAIPLIIADANPGIFSLNDGTPPTVMAFHASDHATAVVSVDGSITAGDTATITVGSNSYTYTVLATDTLNTVEAALVNLLNKDPLVTASSSGQFDRITLTARVAGVAGTNIAIGGSVSSGAAIIITVFNSTTCCINTAGAPVTTANPAVPNELINIFATGLGVVAYDGVNLINVTEGQPYAGPQPNSAESTVSATLAGTTAQVLTAGFQPGSIGTYQVTLQIPSSATTNDQTQLYIAQNAYISNIVNVPVSGSGVTQFYLSPNPIPVPPGATTGSTTIYYQAADNVNIYLGVPSGAKLICSVGAGTGSCQLGNWVTEGMIFYLVDSVTGARLAQTTAHLGQATATISANPNPIVDGTGTGVGVTTISVNANVPVNIYAGGKLFCGPLTTGTCTTGDWVQNGLVFTAVETGTTAVLASVTASLRPFTATLTIPPVGNDGSGLGVATVSFISDVPSDLYVGNRPFCGFALTSGTCTTGKWVSQGLVFNVVNHATGAILGSAAATLVPPAGTINITPNPIVSPNNTGLASGVILVNSNIPANLYAGSTLFCSVLIGTTSCNATNWVADGLVFKLVNPYNNQPYASAQAHVVPPSGTLTLSPNPIAPDSSGLGTAVVEVTATVPVNIYAGPTLLCAVTTGSGTCQTGTWVYNGLVFTMVNQINNQTLTTVTAQVLPASTPTGVLSLSPNPMAPNSTGLASTVVTATTNVAANIYAGSTLFCQAFPGTTTCPTGQWVANGLVFRMASMATGQTLATATAKVLPGGNTPTATLTISPNPIVGDMTGIGSGVLNYLSNVPASIYAGGVLFCSVLVPGSGTCPTGEWVYNGLVFTLVDSQGTTLASATAQVTTSN